MTHITHIRMRFNWSNGLSWFAWLNLRVAGMITVLGFTRVDVSWVMRAVGMVTVDVFWVMRARMNRGMRIRFAMINNGSFSSAISLGDLALVLGEFHVLHLFDGSVSVEVNLSLVATHVEAAAVKGKELVIIISIDNHSARVVVNIIFLVVNINVDQIKELIIIIISNNVERKDIDESLVSRSVVVTIFAKDIDDTVIISQLRAGGIDTEDTVVIVSLNVASSSHRTS